MLPLKYGTFSLIHMEHVRRLPDVGLPDVAFACNFAAAACLAPIFVTPGWQKSLGTYATSTCSLYSPSMKWYVLNRLGDVPADQVIDRGPWTKTLGQSWILATMKQL